MYKITIKLPIGFDTLTIKESIGSFLQINTDYIQDVNIIKLSLDSRKKQVHYLASVSFTINLNNENNSNIGAKNALKSQFNKINLTINKLLKNGNLEKYEPKKPYMAPVCNKKPKYSPVIVGSGPAGLFTGLVFAESGLNPIIIERGENAQKRYEIINEFKKTRKLDPNSNIQFGEGGAGTFSDGKLNTLTKDFRNDYVKQVFNKFGAPDDILYLNKAHIGTDKLLEIIPRIRKEIERFGGKVLFNHKLIGFDIQNNEIQAVKVDNLGKELKIETNDVILATGHSARDVFSMLKDLNVIMEQKAFSIGVRIEHDREYINKIQYGDEIYQGKNKELLPTADYKLSCHLDNGRSVYTFCMCPGGEVVNASSENGYLVTNGMSNYNRNARNSNAAVLVNVTPDDFGSDDVLAGVEFQRKYEKLAFNITNDYKVPCQLLCDFINDKKSTKLGEITPSVDYQFAEIKNCLPRFATESLKQGIQEFDKKMKGYNKPDAVLLGVETRTSSPVRILRDEYGESNIKGLYPTGEGAGYAGGIMSASVDGIKIAEKVIEKYNNMLKTK